MKSDYMKLCEKYDELLKQNEDLQKQNKSLVLQNKIIDDISVENTFLKKEIYELRLLLYTKVNKKVGDS